MSQNNIKSIEDKLQLFTTNFVNLSDFVECLGANVQKLCEYFPLNNRIGNDLRVYIDGIKDPVGRFVMQVPGSEYNFELSSVITPKRAINIYTYFLKTLTFLDLPGDICEFGVYLGETSRELCKYLMHVKSSRKLFMFDTFDGLPLGVEGTEGLYVGTLDSVRNTMRGLGGYTFIPGLIKNQLAPGAFRNYISFAHVDCDLYEGTVDSLLLCESRMFKGAYVVVDDYGTVTWPGVTKACDDLILGQPDKWELINKFEGQIVARKRCDL